MISVAFATRMIHFFKNYFVWCEAQCLATDPTYFIRRDSADLEDTDIYPLLCDEDMPYAGAYNRLGTDPEDLFPTPCSLSGSDPLTCDSASYQYFNTDNWVLRYEGESWEITGK